MLRFVCLALIITLASAKITYKDCGSAEVKDVTVSVCDSSPCTLKKGQEVAITVVLVANQDTATAKVELIAKVGELEIQVPGIETDACKFTSCPFKKGETKTLKYTITVPSFAPTIEADLTVKLVGEKGQMACGTTHGKIVD